jgi:hypothetical protein
MEMRKLAEPNFMRDFAWLGVPPVIDFGSLKFGQFLQRASAKPGFTMTKASVPSIDRHTIETLGSLLQGF